MNLFLFLKQFVSRPKETGAVMPSSNGLAELITDAASLDGTTVIVQFGSGTGVFTEKILRKMPQGAVFFAIEKNAEFVKATHAKCPQATVYNDCATNAAKYLAQHSVPFTDCIISGLPWAVFDETLQDALLDTIAQILKPGGKFVTFAYLHGAFLPAGLRFRKKLRQHFRNVKTTRTVWANVPPAFVYCAER